MRVAFLPNGVEFVEFLFLPRDQLKRRVQEGTVLPRGGRMSCRDFYGVCVRTAQTSPRDTSVPPDAALSIAASSSSKLVTTRTARGSAPGPGSSL